MSGSSPLNKPINAPVADPVKAPTKTPFPIFPFLLILIIPILEASILISIECLSIIFRDSSFASYNKPLIIFESSTFETQTL